MPKVDGLEVLKQIRTDPNLKAIPAVMLTSSREQRDFIEGYDLGLSAYLVKPADFVQFRDPERFRLLLHEPPIGRTGTVKLRRKYASYGNVFPDLKRPSGK